MQHRVVTTLEPSRDLCGTTPEQFAALLEALAPFVVAERNERDNRPGRKRKAGAGRKGAPFWLRLLIALTHLRQGSSLRATGAMFGVDEKSVRNWRDEVVRLLAAHGCRPPGVTRPIRTYEDLADYLDRHEDGFVMIDGTEVRRWSPKDWDAQRAAWSGKTRDHVVKGTIVADRKRRPLWFEPNPTDEGRTHDMGMLRAQATLLALLATSSALVLADSGYQGLRTEIGNRALLPWRKPRGADLPKGDRVANRALSSVRISVEHAIGRMKWWRTMSYWRRPADRFGDTAKAIATLASMT